MGYTKRSTRDIHEIHQHEHDEAENARRVVIVGGGKVDLKVDTSSISESLKTALKDIKLEANMPTNVKPEIQIVEIEKQVFVPQIETKTVEIPVPIITKEVQVVEVEKPIITETLKIETIERPMYVYKTETRMPTWAISVITGQTICILGLLYVIAAKKLGI